MHDRSLYVLLIFVFSSCAAVCDIKNNAVSCAGQSMSSVPDRIKANVAPESILKLDLSNNPINTLPEGSFRQYANLEEIVIANSGLEIIEDGAFDGLQQMLTLNLSNNNLSEIKSEIFKPNFNLQFLILSNNSLAKWDEFKVADFMSLQYLDISYNHFTYLPEDILKALDEHPTFTIVVDGNPWDCSNELFSKSNVAQVLCGFTANGEARKEEVEVTTVPVVNSANDTIGALNPLVETSTTANVCIVKSYRRNLLPIWIALALVTGIVIGNADRIYSWLRSKCSINHPTRIMSE